MTVVTLCNPQYFFSTYSSVQIAFYFICSPLTNINDCLQCLLHIQIINNIIIQVMQHISQ